MRIISQNGNVDLPYEKFVFGITKDNKIACCRECVAPPYEIYNGIIAEYSSKEKALKAMEMLREQYSRIEIIKALASGTCEHMEESLKPKEFKDILKKYINMEVFQFPQDDEIEV
jgi:hypothetical protein